MNSGADPLSIALVGFGYWGANLGRNINAAANAWLCGVADTDEGRLQHARRLLKVGQTWSCLGDVLADPTVEAVALATPAPTHASLALEIIHSGRHVLVEKPLAMSSAEAEELIESATDAGVICMVGHTFLYSEPVRRLRSYIASGELGKIEYLYSQRLNLGRVRADCNALWNFGPHDVSILLYLLDERPSEVSACGLSFLQPGIDDVCFATLQFPSGVGANLHLSWLDPRKTRLMTVVGDSKMAVFDDVSVDQKISIYDSGVAGDPRGEFESLGDFQWRTRAGDIVIPHVAMREPLLTEIEAFAHSCRTGEPPLTDARHGADVVRILEAIDKSVAQRGVPMSLDW